MESVDSLLGVGEVGDLEGDRVVDLTEEEEEEEEAVGGQGVSSEIWQ